MIKRNNTDQQPKPRNFRVYALIFVCGLLLIGGIFLAGRQHFSSMDYGMKNSRLRKQIDDLEAEKRRLLLAREISLSPMEIKKAAMKVGFTDPAAIQTVAQISTTTKDKAVPVTAAAPTNPMIMKTAAVTAAPAATATVASLKKSDKPAKAMKTTMAAE